MRVFMQDFPKGSVDLNRPLFWQMSLLKLHKMHLMRNFLLFIYFWLRTIQGENQFTKIVVNLHYRRQHSKIKKKSRLNPQMYTITPVYLFRESWGFPIWAYLHTYTLKFPLNCIKRTFFRKLVQLQNNFPLN